MEIKIKGAYPTVLDLLAIVGIFFAASILSAFFVRLMGSFLTGIVVNDRAGNARPFDVEGFSGFVYYLLAMSITIAFTLYNRRLRLGKSSRVKIRFNRFDPLMLVWGVILMMMAGVAIDPLLNFFPESTNEMYRQLASNRWIIAATIVLAPVLEEYLFRGVILQDIAGKYGVRNGILYSALMFGVIHINPVQVIAGVVLGLILGFMYFKTKSILVVIVMHMANNLASQLLYFFYGKESLSFSDIIHWKWLYYTLYAICFGVLAFTVYKIVQLQKQHDRTHAPHDAGMENNTPPQNKET